MSKEILFEDEDLFVLMPVNAFIKGHIIIVPKKEFVIMEQVPKELITKMFQLANRLSAILYESLKCHGTNILVQNGLPAGQKNTLFSINIFPRYENDDLKLDWEPKPTNEETLNATASQFGNVKEEEQEKKYLEMKKAKLADTPRDEPELEEDNYLVKHLTRTG